ncbi:MAG: S-methyl-5'-thioadenosine phosphorylase [Deltaproteobacteria bacterium]|nr:S-methyl-5'-thioadenosine phosphorylase [Deltaproteobacteria bacterium]
MSDIKIGVIGGSGLYQMEGMKVLEERRIETPFGDPSDAFIIGEIGGRKVAFLPRHGRGHRLLPSELNYRANLWGMKSLGVEWIISVSAVGSLKIEYKPTDILVPDQFYDRTRHRADTFFGNGIVGHVSLADPTCAKLSECVVEGAKEAGATVHDGGTYVCMEGPLFSTRAESNAYRSHGWDIIGMTNLQEAKLAREAEMSYATMAMVTDYDCWHEEEDDVSGIAVMEVVQKNVIMAQEALRHVIARVPAEEISPYRGILQHSLITEPQYVPLETWKALEPIIGPYMEAPKG